MVKSYLVQHTHWDREWYFTTEDSIVLSDTIFTEVLNELEKNPNVNYTLDGQSSIIDEYLELRPEKLEIVKKLVDEERLFIGPWFTQTDGLLVDQESILRNLIIGINDSINKYGKAMMIGYLPDTFGFNPQIPTLLRHTGIDNFMFWRGINFDTMVESPYFKWKGLGNKEVYAINFSPGGYSQGIMTQSSVDNVSNYVNDVLDPSIKFLQERGDNEEVIIPVGADQKDIVLNFDSIVDEINSKSQHENIISTYPEFVEIIKNKKNLPTYQGDLRSPVHARTHRSIGSVRTNWKLENFNIEQKLLKRIEPMTIIAQKAGIDIGNGLVQRAWKKILENQAHDSMGGCVSNAVAKDISHRLKEAHELVDGIENMITKRIADALNLSANEILLFNTEFKEYNGYKTVKVLTPNKHIKFDEKYNATIISEKHIPKRDQVFDENGENFGTTVEDSYYELDIMLNVSLPAFGYKVIPFEENEKEELISRRLIEDQNKKFISNDYYELKYNSGKIDLITNNGTEYNDILTLVDDANDGDTYDYSPLKDDEPIELSFDEVNIKKDIHTQVMILKGSKKLPYKLDDRLSSDPQLKTFNYTVELELDESDVIEGQINIDNQILSHRLRLKVDTPKSVDSTVAQIQNGFVENLPSQVDDDWMEDYVEKPHDIQIYDKSVSLVDNNWHLNLFTDGLKEYEFVNNSLYITLLATTGQLGKPNLMWRPGRASGDISKRGHIEMPTPLAQELGENSYTFAIQVNDKDFDEKRVAQTTKNRLSPNIYYQKQNLNKFLNRLDNKIWDKKESVKYGKEISLFKFKESDLVTAAYPSYTDPSSFIIRLGNPTKENIKLSSELLNIGKMVSAIEEPIKQENKINPYDYVTMKIKYSAI